MRSDQDTWRHWNCWERRESVDSGPGQGQSHPLQGVPAPRAVSLDALNLAVLLDHCQGPSFRPQSRHPEGSTLRAGAPAWLDHQLAAPASHCHPRNPGTLSPSQKGTRSALSFPEAHRSARPRKAGREESECWVGFQEDCLMGADPAGRSPLFALLFPPLGRKADTSVSTQQPYWTLR